jgi:hypothetical protein
MSYELNLYYLRTKLSDRRSGEYVWIVRGETAKRIRKFVNKEADVGVMVSYPVFHARTKRFTTSFTRVSTKDLVAPLEYASSVESCIATFQFPLELNLYSFNESAVVSVERVNGASYLVYGFPSVGLYIHRTLVGPSLFDCGAVVLSTYDGMQCFVPPKLCESAV